MVNCFEFPSSRAIRELILSRPLEMLNTESKNGEEAWQENVERVCSTIRSSNLPRRTEVPDVARIEGRLNSAPCEVETRRISPSRTRARRAQRIKKTSYKTGLADSQSPERSDRRGLVLLLRVWSPVLHNPKDCVAALV